MEKKDKKPNQAVEHYAAKRGEVHLCRWASEGFLKLTPSITSDETLRQLDYFMSWLSSRGQRTAATRLVAYAKKYQSAFTKPPPTEEAAAHADFDAYVFINREVEELLWILNAVHDHTPPGFDPIMEHALGGNVLGRDDSDKLNSRDYQYQLRVAAYFIKSGFTVDLSTEADILVSKSGFTFFVECKRLKSSAKVRARISEAYKQLQRHLQSVSFQHGFFGMATFDITKIMQPNLGMSAAKTPEGCRDGIRKQLEGFAQEYDRAFDHHRPSRALNVWLQILCPSINATGEYVLTHFSSLHIPHASLEGTRAVAFGVLKAAFEVTT